jgi:uncharacterized protein (UPF0305 family)
MSEVTNKILVDSITEMRELVIENNASIREMKGEMKEFKEHVMGRVERLEKKEGEQSKNMATIVSLLISSGALAVSIIVNFFRHGGK